MVYIPLPTLADRREMVKLHLLRDPSLRVSLTADDVEEMAVTTNGSVSSSALMLIHLAVPCQSGFFGLHSGR